MIVRLEVWFELRSPIVGSVMFETLIDECGGSCVVPVVVGDGDVIT